MSRSATSEQFPFVRAFVQHARLSGENWARSWTDNAVELEFTNAVLFVIDDEDGDPSGFAFVRAPGQAWEITLVAVLPSRRRLGILSQLLQRVKDLRAGSLSGASQLPIQLEVRADNAVAIGAYEQHGFKIIGRRARYYDDGTDAILYRLE